MDTEYLLVMGLFSIYQLLMFILLKQMVPLEANDTALNMVLKQPQEYNYKALNALVNTATIIIVATNAAYGQDTRQTLWQYALPGILMIC